ncbi:MAG: hypothetical protein KDD44_14075, partial [Bdellovibrionales bacterium]|nr:hypothetical protein [Bdellovibrionales bacterium]
WPNDLVVLDGADPRGYRKLGGVLLEVLSADRQSCAIAIGFGLNLQAHSGTREVGGIALDELHGDLGRSSRALVQRAIAGIQAETERYRRSNPLHRFDRWLERSIMHGAFVECFDGARTIAGRVDGLDQHGGLVIRTDCGERRSVYAGEVTVQHVTRN